MAAAVGLGGAGGPSLQGLYHPAFPGVRVHSNPGRPGYHLHAQCGRRLQFSRLGLRLAALAIHRPRRGGQHRHHHLADQIAPRRACPARGGSCPGARRCARQCHRSDPPGLRDRFYSLSLGSSVFSCIQRRGFGDHGRCRLSVVGCPIRSETENLMQIYLANPRGFCAGVDRAIDIVERAIVLFGAPIYVRHEVVHNKYVVDRLRIIGAVFVDELHEVPDGATVIFSAHGVPRVVQLEAQRRMLNVFDATCPLVTKVHMEITRYAREAREVFLIGHAGHPEVEGTIGQFDATLGGSIYLIQTVEDVERVTVRNPAHLAFITQTTLSVDDTASIVAALRARFPGLKAPVKEDICYATQNRQDAVKDLIGRCEVLVVVGSKSSSNSNRLREMAGKNDKAGYLVDGPEDLHREWFEGVKTVGVTAGASAPEILVQGVIAQLRQWGGEVAEELKGREEHVIFALPRTLREVHKRTGSLSSETTTG